MSVSRSPALLANQILVGVYGHLKGDAQPTTKGRIAEIGFVLFDQSTAKPDLKGQDICLDQLYLANGY